MKKLSEPIQKNRLYNIFLPIWLLVVYPIYWLAVLPLNFAVDSAVLLICFKAMRLDNAKTLYKKTIFKVWIFGFVADIIGGCVLFSCFAADKLLGDNAPLMWNRLVNSVGLNPFANIGAVLWVTAAVIAAALSIYLINYHITFKMADIEERAKRRISLVLAITTAPYLFYLPTEWFIK